MFGERQKTNEFLRDPEFFELLLLDPSGEFVFEGFLEDPRLFASEFVMMPGTSSSSSADRMMVGEVHLEAGGVLEDVYLFRAHSSLLPSEKWPLLRQLETVLSLQWSVLVLVLVLMLIDLNTVSLVGSSAGWAALLQAVEISFHLISVSRLIVLTFIYSFMMKDVKNM